MNDNASHAWVTLRMNVRRESLRVKIPRMVFPPRVLQWGAKYFVLDAADHEYHEAACFFVTLESQYPQSEDEILRKEQGPRAWSK